MNISIVENLIKEQCSQLKNLPLGSVNASGSDNFIFRVGDDLLIRLPRHENSELQLKKEIKWLPLFSEILLIPIPQAHFLGKPSSDFLFQWGIFSWIDGNIYNPLLFEHIDNIVDTMVNFIHSLWKVDPLNGPEWGEHNNFRGQPLAERDEQTKEAIKSLPDSYDQVILISLWNTACSTDTHNKPYVWIHGDLHWGNILTKNDNISGIIDFGSLGLGDPAVDIMCAWILFSPEKRRLFKQKINVDTSTWTRAMGWALSFATIALPYYLPKKHLLADIASFTLDNILIDFQAGEL
ncbi:aminoglycoside phosphotransferase family protein [Elizabethkingia miricola]|uniref:aminoglycoside phosphotransferase family protein n=1 Tax=Elizabethkingia miricola TaxID=172045 RepID=UPI00099A13A9|nr:aminoglycoside phosphotransferase family protein [Elizabethkingia miricola]OPC16147.1 hypothetical protein BAY01_00120 [Elizabethkingia miricola]